MKELPRKKLCQIITQYGRSICNDPLCCEGLLRDLCGEHYREVFVLVCALKEQIPSKLLTSHDSIPNNMLMMKLTKQLCNNLALTKNAAEWAVESWALALGIITCSDIKKKKIKKQRRNVIHQKKMFAWNDLTWEGNSKAMFDRIVLNSPKPFRVMTEKKLRENIYRKVEILGKVTESTIMECIKEIIPKTIVEMTLKSIEPLRTITSDMKLVQKHSSQKSGMVITEFMKNIKERLRLFFTDFKRIIQL